MVIDRKTENTSKPSIIVLIKRFSYLWLPIIGAFVGYILTNCNIILTDNETKSIVSNISGVLAGFLFTSYGLFLALPNDNEFVKILRKTKYDRLFYKQIMAGIIINLITLFLSITSVPNMIPIITFCAGMCNTISALFILGYSIPSVYSSRSN